MYSSTLAALLSTAALLFCHVSQISGKCSGGWAIHACRGGNVKRSDVGNRPNLLSTLGMMQKIFGNTDEARATNGREKSRKMLDFWITHKLLAKSRDSTDHHKGRDLVMLSLLKPKRGDGDSKTKNMQLLRIWLKKEKALATRVEKQDGGDELLRALKKERMSAELDKAETVVGAAWRHSLGRLHRYNSTPTKHTGPAWT